MKKELLKLIMSSATKQVSVNTAGQIEVDGVKIAVMPLYRWLLPKYP